MRFLPRYMAGDALYVYFTAKKLAVMRDSPEMSREGTERETTGHPALTWPAPLIPSRAPHRYGWVSPQNPRTASRANTTMIRIATATTTIPGRTPTSSGIVSAGKVPRFRIERSRRG
jgi:hypothetical protein